MNDKDRPHIGIIGMTPQDVSDLKAADKIRKVMQTRESVPSAMEWETDLMK